MKEIIMILQNLIAFKTTADNPQEIKKGFEYIASLFDKSVFDVQTLEKNGKYSLLISFRGRDALQPRILLNGHFDVVPAESESQYQMRVEGNKAFGRGVVDMKGMVAVLIEIMQELGKQNNLPDVALLLNGDEEVGGENGAGYAVRELGLRAQFVLCADGRDAKRYSIGTKAKGVLWLELTAQGKTAHAAHPWLGENAIEKLFEAIQKIKKFIGAMEPEAWKSTANVGIIETSNKTPNKVPGEARAVLDLRFTEELARNPEELFEKIKVLVPDIMVTLIEKGPLVSIEEQNPFLQKFKEVAEEIVGSQVYLKFNHGATDARFFAEKGIPVVVFGAIGAGLHSAEEWVDLESLEKNKQILLEFLQAS